MVESDRLLSDCGGKPPPRVRIPASPPFFVPKNGRFSETATITRKYQPSITLIEGFLFSKIPLLAGHGQADYRAKVR